MLERSPGLWCISTDKQTEKKGNDWRRVTQRLKQDNILTVQNFKAGLNQQQMFFKRKEKIRTKGKFHERLEFFPHNQGDWWCRGDVELQTVVSGVWPPGLPWPAIHQGTCNTSPNWRSQGVTERSEDSKFNSVNISLEGPTPPTLPQTSWAY